LRSYGGLESQDVEFFFYFFAFLGKRPLRENFQNSVPKGIPRYTDRRVVFKFREIWPTEIGKVVRYLLDKNLACLYAAISLPGSRPKSARVSVRQ